MRASSASRVGAAAGHADHDVRQAAAPLQVLERREDLLEGEVAGDAEDHQRVALVPGSWSARWVVLPRARGLPRCNPDTGRVHKFASSTTVAAGSLTQYHPRCLPTCPPNTRRPPTPSARRAIPPERLEHLREMLRVIPKHKGTDHLQADLKRRIKELDEELAGPKRGGARGGPALVIRPGGRGADRAARARRTPASRCCTTG